MNKDVFFEMVENGEIDELIATVDELTEKVNKLSSENKELHVYHHSDNDGAKVSVKAEKNTKGYNWEISVSGASSVEEAMAKLKDAESQLKAEYGERVA